MSQPALDFTGERFTPECLREIWYEHWHRYALAARFAGSRRVLDAACGEGYGSALLATEAASVLGVDLSDEAVAHAEARYGKLPKLRFQKGDCSALDLPAASFDLIVSFETLEHLEAQDELLAGFRRLLAPGGLLLISTPDKAEYSDRRGYQNEFHLKELYREEFEALLSRHFPAYRLYGQKLGFQSLIWPLAGDEPEWGAQRVDPEQPQIETGLPGAPLYWIALCAADSDTLDSARIGLSLFADPAESVYAHYQHEIRKNMAAGAILESLRSELASTRAELAAARAPAPWWRRLFRPKA